MRMTQKHIFYLFSFFVWAGMLSGSLLGQQAAPTPAAKTTAQSVSAQASSDAAHTQIPKTPEEFFARARQLSDLEATGVPFHLKATFVATGDAEYTGNGTFEEWWQSKNVWRKEATLGSYQYVAVHNGAVWAASATMAYTPLRVRQVEDFQVFDLTPPKPKKPVKWKITHVDLTGDPLTVVGSRDWCPQQKKVRCPIEYSFTGNGLLRSYRSIGLYENNSNFQPFDDLQFPRTMTLDLRGKQLLDVQVSTLEKLSDGSHSLFDLDSVPNLGAKPSLLVKLENGIPQKGVTPPKPIHARAPKYPKSEKKSHSEGLVAIGITVDTKGTVREPFIDLSAGPAFDRAAMRAVRDYRFRPTMKDEHPVMAEATVFVAFHIY